MKEFHTNNRNNLKKRLKSEGVELIIISGNSLMQASADRAYPFEQDSNFFYLTGINEPGLTLVLSGENEYLIAPEKSAAKIAFDGDIDTDKLTEISGVSTILSGYDAWQKLEASVKASRKAGLLLGSGSYIKALDMFTNPVRQMLADRMQHLNPDLEVVDLRPHFAALRVIKSEYEIEMTEVAIQKTQKLINEVTELIGTAKSEIELHAEAMRQSVLLEGSFAYAPIIAGGKNAVTLHYDKNNSVLNDGELILFDLGLKHNGYSADLTRTVLPANPTERQKEVYGAVLAVKEYATSLLKPGALLKESEAKVNDFMGAKLVELGLIETVEKEEVRKFYPHSTSHFLGLDVHDVGDYEKPLEPNMLLTVEPGIYIAEENIGIRIEDDILITADGNRNLSYN